MFPSSLPVLTRPRSLLKLLARSSRSAFGPGGTANKARSRSHDAALKKNGIRAGDRIANGIVRLVRRWILILRWLFLGQHVYISFKELLNEMTGIVLCIGLDA